MPSPPIPTATPPSRPDVDAIAERLDALEGRLTSVSTELANQLSELGNDIESLHNRPPGTPVDEGTLESSATRRPDSPASRPATRSPSARISPASPSSCAGRRTRAAAPDNQSEGVGRESSTLSPGRAARSKRSRSAPSSAERLVDERSRLVDAFLIGAEVGIEAELLVGRGQQFVGLGEQICRLARRARSVGLGLGVRCIRRTAGRRAARRRTDSSSSTTGSTWVSDRSPMLAFSPGNSSARTPPRVSE